MSFAFTLPVLMLAVLYRVFKARQTKAWRAQGFNTAVLALCLATLFASYRQRLDLLARTPNLSNLVSHIFLLIACCEGTLYLEYLTTGRPSTYRRRELVLSGSLIVVELAAWLSARPFHGQQTIPDLSVIRDPLVVLYSVVFYAYLVVVTFRMGVDSLRGLNTESVRGSATLAVFGVGGFLETLVTSMWLMAAIWPSAHPSNHTLRVIDALGGFGLILIGGVVIALAVPRSWTRIAAATVLVVEVAPLWSLMRRRFPIVALPLRGRGPLFLAQRALIETQDGLALTRLDLPPSPDMSDLAHALRQDTRGHVPATSLLAGETDERQALGRLGRCYWRALAVDTVSLSA